MLTFTTNIAYNRKFQEWIHRESTFLKKAWRTFAVVVYIYIYVYIYMYIYIYWYAESVNKQILRSRHLCCVLFLKPLEMRCMCIYKIRPLNVEISTLRFHQISPLSKTNKIKRTTLVPRIPTQTWHKHKPDMNSAFDFKETLDFPFQNTTQAKKLWGRFSDPYQIKIYRISTRLNTTPRTSAHVEAVRCLAFRWLERCLRSKTFGLGKSMQNLDLVAEYDRCLCPKEMMLKAQSPVIRYIFFLLTCKPPNSCLVHFPPHFLVVEMKSQPTFVTKVRERWTWANTVHLRDALPVVERWRTCVQQKDYVIGHCRSSGLMSELLDLWEEPIFFWTMSLGSVAFEIIRPWKPFKASMSFLFMSKNTRGDSFRTSSVNRTWPTMHMNSNINFSPIEHHIISSSLGYVDPQTNFTDMSKKSDHVFLAFFDGGQKRFRKNEKPENTKCRENSFTTLWPQIPHRQIPSSEMSALGSMEGGHAIKVHADWFLRPDSPQRQVLQPQTKARSIEKITKGKLWNNDTKHLCQIIQHHSCVEMQCA